MNDKKHHNKKQGSGSGSSGRLRIGDNWNAITIIALSQSNPLKAIAEFVENSIDAGAKNITIVRGKEKGESFLRIIMMVKASRRTKTVCRISNMWPPISVIQSRDS